MSETATMSATATATWSQTIESKPTLSITSILSITAILITCVTTSITIYYIIRNKKRMQQLRRTANVF